MIRLGKGEGRRQVKPAMTPASSERDKTSAPKKTLGRLLAAIAMVCGMGIGADARAFTPILFPSLYADGTPVDTAEIGNRKPLVLIHGMGGSDTNWEAFLRFYWATAELRASVKPYSFKYDNSVSGITADPAAPVNITQLGAALRNAMQLFYDRPTAGPDYGFGNQPAIILGHSMGGLVARSMMQEYSFADGQRGGGKVLRLITLGTPHHGSPLADAALDPANAAITAQVTGAAPGFIRDLMWDNYDGLYSTATGHCNPWLSQLNNYSPAPVGQFGVCPAPVTNALTGYYDKIITYASGNILSTDGLVNSALLPSYNYMRGSGLNLAYDNDGLVPLQSAAFDRAAIVATHTTSCDHRGLVTNPVSWFTSPTLCDASGCAQERLQYAVCDVNGAPIFTYDPGIYYPYSNGSVFSGAGMDIILAAINPPPLSQALSAPTGLAVIAIGATQADLSWNNASGATVADAYWVYRDGVLLATLGNVTSYSDSGLTASTSHSYTVAACDAAGNCSAQSAAAWITTSALSVNDCLFNWGEDNYSSILFPSRPVSHTTSPYYYRYYTATNSYLGVSSEDSHLYYMSISTGLVDLGLAAIWSAQAGCI